MVGLILVPSTVPSQPLELTSHELKRQRSGVLHVFPEASLR